MSCGCNSVGLKGLSDAEVGELQMTLFNLSDEAVAAVFETARREGDEERAKIAEAELVRRGIIVPDVGGSRYDSLVMLGIAFAVGYAVWKLKPFD